MTGRRELGRLSVSLDDPLRPVGVELVRRAELAPVVEPTPVELGPVEPVRPVRELRTVPAATAPAVPADWPRGQVTRTHRVLGGVYATTRTDDAHGLAAYAPGGLRRALGAVLVSARFAVALGVLVAAGLAVYIVIRVLARLAGWVA